MMTIDISQEDLIISEFLKSIGLWRKHKEKLSHHKLGFFIKDLLFQGELTK